MAIEGPLRELGIHDVFQLLDLSRKTGMLRVTSQLRDDEGVVYFDSGRIVHASIRSRPSTPETGALSDRERQRKARAAIETTVFELMSWREGYFSFEERKLADIPPGAQVNVESLLMEGARRIDEWSRIADTVPNLAVIPALAPISETPETHETQLDLLPNEWEVLTMIDGERDLRAISTALKRAEFDVAKIAYGLATTGIIEIKHPRRVSELTADAEADAALAETNAEANAHFDLGFTALRAGNMPAARASFEHFLALAPTHPNAEKARSALDAVARMLTVMEPPRHG
jgi:hypothetical protein